MSATTFAVKSDVTTTFSRLKVAKLLSVKVTVYVPTGRAVI